MLFLLTLQGVVQLEKPLDAVTSVENKNKLPASRIKKSFFDFIILEFLC